ncbi:MAG: redoxin domain-containing protein [Promicromonosporaceae bacterium]|nr:redoxin domain-containing protein [Promicromonosporaceae bacterium]
MEIKTSRVRAAELVGRGWLNTGGRTLGLADLRGKIVVLDFWTFCCINCLHVLDELRELEEQHRDALVIVGVHSPKFEYEADPAALAAAVERYEVHHPVLDDPELVTWSAYGARAWPTLVVIDPEGYVVANMAGEGHASALAALVAELIADHDVKGTLHRGNGPYTPPAPTSGTLRFPAKVIRLPNGNLLVADAGHHSLAELLPDGESLIRRIGTGERGFVDGKLPQFSEPNGLCLVPAKLREKLGYDVVVADTVNHALRGVRLADGWVTTLAGTGEQFMVGGLENYAHHTEAFLPEAGYPSRELRLSSPWDVVWSEAAGGFIIAMAGNHTLWLYDPAESELRLFAGTFNEGLADGMWHEAWFAQPSGLAVDESGAIWVVDSETSALRAVVSTITRTLIGKGLFDFGHRDGVADQAMLQHPLGVAMLPDGSVVIADTYNGALRRFDPSTNEVATIATGLAEPSDVLVEVDSAGSTTVELLVVESAAHRLTRIALPPGLAGEILDHGAQRTQRPATVIAPGSLRLAVPFAPASGQMLDDRWGPASSLQVSSTPPELLLEGAGDGGELFRELRINPDVSTGVLHVTAKAASCDKEGEFPACHLAQQDWGVPVVVRDGGDTTLILPLRG